MRRYSQAFSTASNLRSNLSKSKNSQSFSPQEILQHACRAAIYRRQPETTPMAIGEGMTLPPLLAAAGTVALVEGSGEGMAPMRRGTRQQLVSPSSRWPAFSACTTSAGELGLRGFGFVWKLRDLSREWRG